MMKVIILPHNYEVVSIPFEIYDKSLVENEFLNKVRFFPFDNKKTKKPTFSYEISNEYRILMQRFSSGVRLRELSSIAIIISKIVPKVKEPNRDEKRNFPLLIEWFHNNWELVYPILPFIQLRDENNKVIDGERELSEMRLNSKRTSE